MQSSHPCQHGRQSHANPHGRYLRMRLLFVRKLFGGGHSAAHVRRTSQQIAVRRLSRRSESGEFWLKTRLLKYFFFLKSMYIVLLVKLFSLTVQ